MEGLADASAVACLAAEPHPRADPMCGAFPTRIPGDPDISRDEANGGGLPVRRAGSDVEGAGDAGGRRPEALAEHHREPCLGT